MAAPLTVAISTAVVSTVFGCFVFFARFAVPGPDFLPQAIEAKVIFSGVGLDRFSMVVDAASALF